VTGGTAAPALPLTAVQRRYRQAVLAKLERGTYRLEEVPVCLCGQRGGVTIADHDRYGFPVGVVLCTTCGLARSTPRLAAADLPAFYEDDYHPLHGLQHGPDPDPNAALFRLANGAAILAFLDDLLPPRPLRVADVGCGTGRVLREFAAALDRPVAVVGCDYSAAFVDAGKRAGSDIRHGGPETMMNMAPFDVVILSHVVEHFPEPVADLAAVRALGHSRALFYVEVPGLLSIDHKPEYAYRLDQYLTIAHTFHFTLETLTATMNRAGFGIARGDEYVRSVFIPAPAATPRNDPELAPRILASLNHLERSWPLRARRLYRMTRQRAVAIAKRVLPESAIAALRRVRGR